MHAYQLPSTGHPSYGQQDNGLTGERYRFHFGFHTGGERFAATEAQEVVVAKRADFEKPSTKLSKTSKVQTVSRRAWCRQDGHRQTDGPKRESRVQ